MTNPLSDHEIVASDLQIVATDLIVRTRNPELLDQTVQRMGAAVVVEGSYNGDTCRVRVFGPPRYLRWAIPRQGYGEIVGEEPV